MSAGTPDGTLAQVAVPATPGHPVGLVLPAGTVTFLFTDVEGSTRLLESHPDAYRAAVRRHHDLLQEAVESSNGTVFETVGDAVYAAFVRPTDAVRAALAGQAALAREVWGAVGAVRVRMGIHLGEVELQHTGQGQHYFGAPLYRCARLMGTAHGGQVVLSEAAASVVRDGLPPGANVRDLGEHRLKDLARPERIYQLTHVDLPADFPPLRTLDTLPNNLPLQLTSFVGREADIEAVCRLLTTEQRRLLTLVGAAGTGKTRLALQVAADVLDAFPDGIWLAELASLSDPGGVAQAVCTAAGIRHEPGDPALDSLAAALRGRHVLLVLDNCEHLVEACARLAETIVRSCPNVHLLATSREPLGVAGESVWRVPPLRVPDTDALPPLDELRRYEAVRLFAVRAEAAQPGFVLSAENAPAVVEICYRLDGIPLAIELAAARVKLLAPQQLLARLDDRFRLLTGGSRTALPRQRTLQALVDWSYELLSAGERVLFDRLSIFAGGFTLHTAETICAGTVIPEGAAADMAGVESWEVLDFLALLVDKSLVAAEVADAGPHAEARYRLLETLRQYGRLRLEARGEAAVLRRRHCDYYARLSEEAEHRLVAQESASAPRVDAWLARLAADLENLRAALHWALEHGEAEQSAHLAGALWLAIEHRLEHPNAS